MVYSDTVPSGSRFITDRIVHPQDPKHETPRLTTKQVRSRRIKMRRWRLSDELARETNRGLMGPDEQPA